MTDTMFAPTVVGADWQIRVVTVDGEPWFVASDVALVLGYRDAFNLTRRLEPSEQRSERVQTPRSSRVMSLINEPGALRAAYATRNQATGGPFRRWLVEEALPALRPDRPADLAEPSEQPQPTLGFAPDPDPDSGTLLTEAPPPPPALSPIPSPAELTSDMFQAFQSDGWKVRAAMIDGEPWFSARDVAVALGYRDAEKLTRRIDPEDKGTRPVGTPGGVQEGTFINESGLYTAIIGSRVEGAKRFKRWVTREVLPAIRRTGGYSVATRFEIPRTYADALIAAGENLKRAEAAEDRAEVAEHAVAVVEAQLVEALPKAEAFDATMSAEGLLSLQEAADNLAADMLAAGLGGAGRTTLMRFLRDNKIIMPVPSTLPYARFIPRYFNVIRGSHAEHGVPVVHTTTKVTSDGVEWIRGQIKRHGEKTDRTVVSIEDGRPITGR